MDADKNKVNGDIDLTQLKALAQRAVFEKDGRFGIKFSRPVVGVDVSGTFPTRLLAVDAAFNALKKQYRVKQG